MAQRRPPLRLPQLSLNVVASLTPDRWEVKLVEEDLEDVDLDQPCDLVGISAMTANVTRGYELAAQFRERGRTVVMGGVHATVLPDEAARHADSVSSAGRTPGPSYRGFRERANQEVLRSKNIDVSG